MNPFYAVVRFIVRPFAYLYFRLRVVGRENIPKDGTAIVCCNHTSISDAWLLVATFPRQIFFMSKSELFKNSIVKWFIKHMGAFAVARGTGGTDGIKAAVDIVERGDVIGIFPEGTRNPVGRPGRGKAGVAYVISKTGAPVIPVSIHRERLTPFTRVTVRYGKMLTDEIKLADDSKSEIRRVSGVIMDNITKQWEEGY